MRRLFTYVILAAGLAAFALMTSCRRKPAEQVVLYVSADEHIARSVIDRFQNATGIEVKVVGDTEAKKTSGLVDRLRAEERNPQADVWWSSEVILTIALAEEGILDEHLSDATADWPREWRDGQRQWFAFAARPRVIVYAPDRVPEADRPMTWMDLTKGRWKGRMVMADPRFGTTGTHLAVMLWQWDREIMPGYFGAWAMGLAANNVRLLPSGNAGVVDAVAKGEADIGLTDADDVWAAKARGLNVELIYPAHGIAEVESDPNEPRGTLLIPNTVARIKGGPNPAPAAKLIDFLLSEETERLLAESPSHNIPMRDSLRASYAEYAVPQPLEVDWARAAAMRERALVQFFEAMETIKRERAEAEASARDVEDDDRRSPDISGGDDGN